MAILFRSTREKIENDEERYTKNAKIFIEEIGKKETVVEKLKSMFENMKSKFRTLVTVTRTRRRHRPSKKRLNGETRNALRNLRNLRSK